MSMSCCTCEHVLLYLSICPRRQQRGVGETERARPERKRVRVRTRLVSGLCHMRERIERGNQSRVYVHASVLWHIYTQYVLLLSCACTVALMRMSCRTITHVLYEKHTRLCEGYTVLASRHAHGEIGSEFVSTQPNIESACSQADAGF